MLAVHGNELATYTLKLRESHWCRGELNRLLDVLDGYLAAPLSCMVFLICHYLGEDVGCGLVELVEVILFCRGFLVNVSLAMRAIDVEYVLILLPDVISRPSSCRRCL